MKKYIYWIILLAITSCSNFPKNEVIVYEKFPISKNVIFQEIPTPPVSPFTCDMIFVDSTLILMDMKSDTIFHLFSLPLLKYTESRITRGQGPNEEIMIVPYLSSNGKSNLLYRTIEDVKISHVENNNLIVNETIKLPTEFNNVFHVIRMNDCLYGYDGSIKSKEEFISYNLKTKKIFRFGNFPEIDSKNHNEQKAIILYSKILINKDDDSKFAVLYDKLPVLRIFSNEGNLLKELMLRNRQKSPLAYLDKNINEGKLDRMTLNYLKIRATNSFIYGLYSGKTHAELNSKEKKIADYGYEIHVWDWEGNPVACYKLPKAVFAFAVSKDDKFIICSSLLNDDKLLKFNM